MWSAPEATVRVLPQYDGLYALEGEFGMTDGVERANVILACGDWCTMVRELPYSENSASKLTEVYVLTKSEDVEGFSTETCGGIADGEGRVLKTVPLERTKGEEAVFAVMDTPPQLAFFVLHEGTVLRGYRFRVQLHFESNTKNKLAVQQHLQAQLRDIHPVILPTYFRRLVSAVKARGPKAIDEVSAQYKRKKWTFREALRQEEEERRVRKAIHESLRDCVPADTAASHGATVQDTAPPEHSGFSPASSPPARLPADWNTAPFQPPAPGRAVCVNPFESLQPQRSQPPPQPVSEMELASSCHSIQGLFGGAMPAPGGVSLVEPVQSSAPLPARSQSTARCSPPDSSLAPEPELVQQAADPPSADEVVEPRRTAAFTLDEIFGPWGGAQPTPQPEQTFAP